MSEPEIASQSGGADLQAALLCPACGYDLRGAPEDRCSECGLKLDRAALDHSGFPWTYRQTIGRVKAFLKTAWLMTVDAKSLRFEASKRQSVKDAAIFQRWVVAAIAASFLTVVAMFMVHPKGGIKTVIVQRQSPFPVIVQLTGAMQDVLVPWSAGVALPAAAYAYAILLAVCTAGAAGSIFRTRGMPTQQAEAVRAIVAYVSAPLAWLLPAAIALAAALYSGMEPHQPFRGPPISSVMFLVSLLLAITAVGATVHRTGQWRARTTHNGYATGFLAMGELLLRWVIGIAVVLFVVPWCVGFIWIFVDSLRA